MYLAAAALRDVGGQGAQAWGAGLLAIAVAWAAAERERWRGLAEWGLALAIAYAFWPSVLVSTTTVN